MMSPNWGSHQKEILFLELQGVDACYHPVKKQLIIDTQNMRNNIDLHLLYVDFWPIEKIKVYRNLVIVQTLFHEIEHMEQYRKVKSDLLDFESNLLRLCYGPTLYYEIHQSEVTSFDYTTIASILSYFEFEAIYYIEDPRERMAQIRSYQYILEIIRSFYKEESDLYQYEQNELNFEKLQGYKMIGNNLVAPTVDFLNNMKKETALTYFDTYACCEKMLDQTLDPSFANENTLEKRLLLGLPIQLEEYDKEQQKLLYF